MCRMKNSPLLANQFTSGASVQIALSSSPSVTHVLNLKCYLCLDLTHPYSSLIPHPSSLIPLPQQKGGLAAASGKQHVTYALLVSALSLRIYPLLFAPVFAGGLSGVP